MLITSDSYLRLDSNKIFLDTTNDSTLNDMGNKLCNENDVSTVPVIAPVVVESNVTSSVTGETDMTSGGNLTCNMASCEQTTNETLSDRDNNLTSAATTTVLSKDMLTRYAPLRNEVALTCTTCLSTKSSKTNPRAVSPLGLIDIARFM